MNYLQKKKLSMLNSIQSGGRLPSEYQEVQYIQSYGNEWIDTNITMDLVDYVKMRVNVQGTNNTYGYLFGNYKEDSNWTRLFYRKSNTGFCGLINTRTVGFYANTFNLNEDVVFEAGLGYFYINENKVTYNRLLGDLTDLTLFVFNANATSSLSSRTTNMKLYSCICKNGEDKVLDLVPCYRKSDGEIGLYDLCGNICPITNTPFFVNVGTGNFTKGSDVN